MYFKIIMLNEQNQSKKVHTMILENADYSEQIHDCPLWGCRVEINYRGTTANFWGDGYAHYLAHDDGFTGYLCQNSPDLLYVCS
jgi:hypothetical protein